MIYIIVFILMLAGVYAFDIRGYRKMYSVSFWLFFAALVIIAGLRYRIGTDSIIYEAEYEDFPRLWELGKYKFDSIRYEPGFILFASLPRSISSDFTLLQFFHAIIINLVVFWFILKNTRNRFLCLTLYYLILYFNLNTQVLRESLAVAIFLLSWPFFRDGKWIQYYLLIILAFFFHSSALLLFVLPVFLLPGIRELFVLGKRTVIIALGILVVGYYIQQRFSEVFSLMAVTERMMDKVNNYVGTEYSSGKLSIVGISINLMQNAVYPLVAIYFIAKNKKSINKEQSYSKKKKLKRIRQFDRWETMVVVGVYFLVFSIPMFIFGRYFNYFGMFCVTTVASWAFTKLRIRGKTYRLKLVYWAIIFLPYFVLNINAYNSNANRNGTLKTYMIYYPYYTRLDPKMDPDRENIYRYLDAR